MLAGFPARSPREIRLSGPEVSRLISDAEPPPPFHVQSNSRFDHGTGSGFPWIRSTTHQLIVLHDMAESRRTKPFDRHFPSKRVLYSKLLRRQGHSVARPSHFEP